MNVALAYWSASTWLSQPNIATSFAEISKLNVSFTFKVLALLGSVDCVRSVLSDPKEPEDIPPFDSSIPPVPPLGPAPA
jgi:hypothetical protein